MYISLIFSSFFSFIITGLFGRYLGYKGCSVISVNFLAITFFLSLLAFYEISLAKSSVYLYFGNWINSEVLIICWSFQFDSLTSVMCIVVTSVSLLVHIYSIEYMCYDPHLPRFMSYLSLFTFFMLILITSDNFIQMFLGWEGVGLTSYLLINFWFTRIQANKAAIKAMIFNRIGDFFLIVSIYIMFVYFKSVDYATIASLITFFKIQNLKFLCLDFNIMFLICIFLFLGAIGKSAQLGLHAWLPDAMEGPTPVSALIHAATMVTAGVFLIVRCSFLFEHVSNCLQLIAILGSITALFASTIGLVQNDLKRVIAYSTCSQLGYMIFSCGLSNYSNCIFHLINHAFFKALLFLGAGAIIHILSDEQDMRKMGGLKNLLPSTYCLMLIGSLALIGFPFLSGFYSKDLILESVYIKYTSIGHFCYFLGTFGAFITAFYSIRLLCLTFLVQPNGYKSTISFAKETFNFIFLVLIILSLLSIFIGFCLKNMIVSIGNDFFNISVYHNLKIFNVFDTECLKFFYKILPVILTLFGANLSFFLYIFKNFIFLNFKISFVCRKLYIFLNYKWYIDKIYNEILSQIFFKFGYTISYKKIDKGILETLGPTGLTSAIYYIAHILHKAKTGSLYHYMCIILIMIVFFLIFKKYWSIFEYFLDCRVILLIIVAFISVFNKKN